MRIVMRSSVAAVVSAVLTTLGPVRAAWAEDVVVFAAASLKNALDDASHAFSGAGGASVKISYAASSNWPSRSRAAPRPTSSSRPISTGWTTSQEAQSDQGGDAHEPARQPTRAGRAGGRQRQGRHQARLRSRRAARAAGAWRWPIPPAFRPANTARRRSKSSASGTPCSRKSPRAENVRAALLFVDRKETPLGIVYATDAASDPKVKIVGGVSRGHAPADHLPGGA